MSTNVIMPALGVAQDTGKVLRWHRAAGDSVVKGEPLLEIETDKVTVDVEAPASGVLGDITAPAGDDVPVGAVIALIHAPNETPLGSAAPIDASASGDVPAGSAAQADRRGATAAASPVAARVAADHHVDLSHVTPTGGRIKKDDVLGFVATRDESRGAARLAPASPKARRLATERGLDLARIRGNGPGGAVLADDVQAALADDAQTALTAAAPVASISAGGAATAQTVSCSSAWRLMADRTAQSWTTIPHFFLNRTAEAGRLVAWRRSVQRRAAQRQAGDTDPAITYSDLVIRLVAAALRAHPRLNASYRDGSIALNDAINIGIAVAAGNDLVVPVLHHADRLGLRELAALRHDLVARAQSGALRPDDVGGGTFTVSNLGMYGVDSFNAIINPPQAAILAVGRLAERVVAVAGRPAVRPTIDLTLSCDHRVVDGARGALFLSTLCELIADPLALAD